MAERAGDRYRYQTRDEATIGCWRAFLLCIHYPIRFVDKGLWYLFWSVFFPAMTFNIGFLLQCALNWDYGLGEYIQTHSAFYSKMISGQSEQVTFTDLFIYSSLNLIGPQGVLGTITMWSGNAMCIWSLHAPLKYIWKPFLAIFLVETVFATLLAPIIVLSLDVNVWTNYNVSREYALQQVEHSGMYQALGAFYMNAPWWYDEYWTYLNIVQGIIYGVTQPILFHFYLTRNADSERQQQIRHWYGFYNFFNSWWGCILYGVGIFTAQLVGIQGFMPAFFFIFLWYRKCWCAMCCKSSLQLNVPSQLRYSGQVEMDPYDRGSYCCHCIPVLPLLTMKIGAVSDLPQQRSVEQRLEMELLINHERDDEKRKLHQKLTRLMACKDKQFAQKVSNDEAKQPQEEEEGLFDEIMQFIDMTDAAEWWTENIMDKLAQIRFDLTPEQDGDDDDDFLDLFGKLHIGDVKPFRKSPDTQRMAAGNVEAVMRKMNELIAQRKKIKPAGCGYAMQPEVLHTSAEHGVFVDTMSAGDADHDHLDKHGFFRFGAKQRANAMTNIIDYEEYKHLLLSAWRAKYDEDYIVAVEAGCTYYALNQHTWPRPIPPKDWVPNGNVNALQRQTVINPKTGKKYKYLAGQPGYQGLSIGGTINVGVQGTGTHKTANVIERADDEKDDDYPAYAPDRSQCPGDYVRSFTMLIADKPGEKVRKIQLEPASNPFHDAAKWREQFGDDDAFELIQDDEVFYGALVSLGTVGIHIAYIFELVDASFEEEHRYIVNWDEFKERELPKIEQGVQSGEIVRWQLWLSPYTTMGQFADSPPVVVSTYRLTDKIPPPVLTADNAGNARSGFATGLVGGAKATWVSQVFPRLTPLLLEGTLRGTVYGDTEEKQKCAMDPFAAVALGAAVLVPSCAVGTAVDYEDLVASIEAWHQWAQDNFPEIPIVLPTAARISSKSNQLLACHHGSGTVWYESVGLDWHLSKWPRVGKVPNLMAHLYGVNRLFHEQFKGRYNMGLAFDVKDEKAKIWKNQQREITQFVEKVYKRFTYEDGPFCNQFTRDSGLEEMAFGGKTIQQLITANDEK